MSYCWRLQYYCKLGAAHRAGPIYYVSRLPQQAHQTVHESVENSDASQGEQRGTLRVWLRHHIVPQAGRELQSLSLCQAVSSGPADGWGHQVGGGGSVLILDCDTHPLTCSKTTLGPGVEVGDLCPE